MPEGLCNAEHMATRNSAEVPILSLEPCDAKLPLLWERSSNDPNTKLNPQVSPGREGAWRKISQVLANEQEQAQEMSVGGSPREGIQQGCWPRGNGALPGSTGGGAAWPYTRTRATQEVLGCSQQISDLGCSLSNDTL